MREAQAIGGQGSTANVIAALASFFLPGLGQLVQGRWLTALFHVILAGALWVITFATAGWIANLWSCLDAALYRPRG